MAILNFRQWVEMKTVMREDFDSPKDPTDMFKFNTNGNDIGNDYENIQREVTKVVMSKYHRQFMRFLTDLAEENSDGELKNLARKLETDKSSGSPSSWKAEHPRDRDEIVAPESDRGIDPNSAD